MSGSATARKLQVVSKRNAMNRIGIMKRCRTCVLDVGLFRSVALLGGLSSLARASSMRDSISALQF